MEVQMQQRGILFEPLKLPCGVTLKNRIAKLAMSDSLGDGTSHPADEQIRLYQRWTRDGLAISIIGEVQGSSGYAEKPGNLVLNETSDLAVSGSLPNRAVKMALSSDCNSVTPGHLPTRRSVTPEARVFSACQICAAPNSQ